MARFLAATALVGSIDIGLYLLLHSRVPVSLAKGLSFIVANATGYVFHKYWTFRKRRRSAAEAIRYVLVNVLLLGTNVLTNRGVLALWPDRVVVAAAAASLVAMLVSFVCKKWWVFR